MTAGDALTMSTIIVAAEQQISCEVGDEAVLLNAEDGEYYGLNPVAASVWRTISEPRSLDTVRDALLAEYSGISPDECERALLALVGEMLSLGVVRIH
jgi:hypothetical protein